MSIASLVVIVLVVAGRSADPDSGLAETRRSMPPVHLLDPVLPDDLSACRHILVPSESLLDPVASAIESLEASRARDQRCGAAAPDVAVCRGMWAAWVLDPVVVARTHSEHLDRAANIVGWAIESAASSSTDNEPLAAALRHLARINQRLADAELSDVEKFALIERRIGSDIIDPLIAAERRCNAHGFIRD